MRFIRRTIETFLQPLLRLPMEFAEAARICQDKRTMPDTKQYTRDEVASSNGNGKTLLILHDKVYDVSSFLNEHPGGEEILLDHGGKDGSEDFDDVGHSNDAFELMSKYLVGELVESERTNKTPKKTWPTSYGTQPPKEEGGLSPAVLLAAVAVLLAVAYFMYL